MIVVGLHAVERDLVLRIHFKTYTVVTANVAIKTAAVDRDTTTGTIVFYVEAIRFTCCVSGLIVVGLHIVERDLPVRVDVKPKAAIHTDIAIEHAVADVYRRVVAKTSVIDKCAKVRVATPRVVAGADVQLSVTVP